MNNYAVTLPTRTTNDGTCKKHRNLMQHRDRPHATRQRNSRLQRQPKGNPCPQHHKNATQKLHSPKNESQPTAQQRHRHHHAGMARKLSQIASTNPLTHNDKATETCTCTCTHTATDHAPTTHSQGDRATSDTHALVHSLTQSMKTRPSQHFSATQMKTVSQCNVKRHYARLVAADQIDPSHALVTNAHHQANVAAEMHDVATSNAAQKECNAPTTAPPRSKRAKAMLKATQTNAVLMTTEKNFDAPAWVCGAHCLEVMRQEIRADHFTTITSQSDTNDCKTEADMRTATSACQRQRFPLACSLDKPMTQRKTHQARANCAATTGNDPCEKKTTPFSPRPHPQCQRRAPLPNHK